MYVMNNIKFRNTVLNLDIRWMIMVSFMPLPLCPEEITRRYILGGPVGPRDVMDILKIIPRIEHRAVHPIAYSI
jgi:hypothetical protein